MWIDIVDIALAINFGLCLVWFFDWYFNHESRETLWAQVDIRLCAVAVIILWGVKLI